MSQKWDLGMRKMEDLSWYSFRLIFSILAVLGRGLSEPGELVFRSPLNFHTYSIDTIKTTVLIEIEGGMHKDGVLVEFDRSLTLRETFNENGVARIFAEGVFVGSHLIVLLGGGRIVLQPPSI